jgi:hypothetical protein
LWSALNANSALDALWSELANSMTLLWQIIKLNTSAVNKLSYSDPKEPQRRTSSISQKKETSKEALSTPAPLPLSLASPSTLHQQLRSFAGETKNKTSAFDAEAERKERVQLAIIWTSRIGKSSLHSETRATLAIKARTMERVRCKVTKQ